MSQSNDLGVPDTAMERAWENYIENGVMLPEYAREFNKRRQILREWAEIGMPLR